MADKPAGFFGKDEDFGTRLDSWVEQGEQFVALEVMRDTPFVNPKDGETITSRTKIVARKFDPETFKAYGLPVVVKTLGQVIYDHAGEQVPGDFPAVCYWDRVEVAKFNNEAMILRRVSAWPLDEATLAYMTGAA